MSDDHHDRMKDREADRLVDLNTAKACSQLAWEAAEKYFKEALRSEQHGFMSRYDQQIEKYVASKLIAQAIEKRFL